MGINVPVACQGVPDYGGISKNKSPRAPLKKCSEDSWLPLKQLRCFFESVYRPFKQGYTTAYSRLNFEDSVGFLQPNYPGSNGELDVV